MIHRDRTHHRPRVYRAPGARSKWSFPWKAYCGYCGFSTQEMTHHNAFVEAMNHASLVR